MPMLWHDHTTHQAILISQCKVLHRNFFIFVAAHPSVKTEPYENVLLYGIKSTTTVACVVNQESIVNNFLNVDIVYSSNH